MPGASRVARVRRPHLAVGAWSLPTLIAHGTPEQQQRWMGPTLRGEMSWIGPRPESLPPSEWYEREIGCYSYRYVVLPGITGWAQVQQGYAARPENVKHKLHYDFYYIKHFSPWLDLIIAAQTVRTVLTGFGAR